MITALVVRGSLVYVLCAIVLVFTLLDGPTFFSFSNFAQVLSSQAAAGVLAVGVTIALVAGEIDLSITGVMGTVAGIVALSMTKGIPPVPSVLIGCAIGLGFGIANGLLAAYARLNSIISTLAMGTIATGIGLAIAGPDTITGLPPAFGDVFVASWLGIQTPFYMFLVLVVISALVLQRTPVGRRLFFVGQSETASRLMGLRVERLKIAALAVTGLLAGAAGIIVTGQTNGVNVTVMAPYLLPAFAASFLGTAAITPGRFNAVGSLIGILILGLAQVGLNEGGVPNWVAYVFNGALLIISLGVFTFVKAMKERVATARAVRRAALSEASLETAVGAP